MVYINKDGYDNEAKRRKEARNRAEYYGSADLERQFIEWCQSNGKPSHVIRKGLEDLRIMAETFRLFAEHETDSAGQLSLRS